MKQFMALLMAPLFAAFMLLFVPATAQADSHWVHYDANPAYPTITAAMADRENVFKKWGYEGDVLTAAMQATNNLSSCKMTVIKPGMYLSHMQSGGGNTWEHVEVMNDPSFGDGVPAEECDFTVGDTKYQIFLPVGSPGGHPYMGCFNWSDIQTSGNPVAEAAVTAKPCAFIRVQVTPTTGRALHDYFLSHQQLSDQNHCFGVRLLGVDLQPIGSPDYQPLSNPCQDGCNAHKILEALNTDLQLQASQPITQDGFIEIRVPRSYADTDSPYTVDFCRHGDIPSCGALVLPANYHKDPATGTYVAYIWNSEEDIPTDPVRKHWKLHFVLPEVEDGHVVLDEEGYPKCPI